MQLKLKTFSGLGLAITAVTAAMFLAFPNGAQAQDVHAGHDLLKTNGTSTSFDFGPQPIPADFFAPGSDPFAGVIDLEGLPLPGNLICLPPPTLCPDDDLGQIDTIVKRMQDALLPTIGSSDTIEIELVALSLRSVSPITVTYNGGMNPELWDVEVCPSSQPQQTGTMTITKTHANGGTFDSQLPVTPLFTFTRQSDSQQVFYDGAYSGTTDTLTTSGVPWEYVAPPVGSCRSNFCTPNAFVHSGNLMIQGLLPGCPLINPVPAIPATGLALLAVALIALGVWVMRRIARRAEAI